MGDYSGMRGPIFCHPDPPPNKFCRRLPRITSTSTARTAHRHRNRSAHDPHFGGGGGRGPGGDGI
eukprot:409089-Pyramimonas_sp.AAC.1